MSYNVLEKIRMGLETRLSNMPSVPVVAGIKQIAWENKSFEPAGNIWLKPTFAHLQAPQDTLGLNGSLMRNGIFAVNIFFKKQNPINAANDIAGDLESYFRAGTFIAQNDIQIVIKQGSVRNQIENTNDAWMNLPFIADWYVYDAITVGV